MVLTTRIGTDFLLVGWHAILNRNTPHSIRHDSRDGYWSLDDREEGTPVGLTGCSTAFTPDLQLQVHLRSGASMEKNHWRVRLAFLGPNF